MNILDISFYCYYYWKVFKDGDGYRAAWFPAKILSLEDGKVYVSYTELTSGEGM